MSEPSWIDAMQEEIHEFERLKVWELVPCLDNVFLIKLKWIYKVKTDESSGVLKNKARLDNPSHMFKLKKALYGIKQAPRAWYPSLHPFLYSELKIATELLTNGSSEHVGSNLAKAVHPGLCPMLILISRLRPSIIASESEDLLDPFLLMPFIRKCSTQSNL
ncbi:hypothetical protein Tco_0781007 [Tanacetum coccineum]